MYFFFVYLLFYRMLICIFLLSNFGFIWIGLLEMIIRIGLPRFNVKILTSTS